MYPSTQEDCQLILLVEDDPDQREVYRRYLNSKGIFVIETSGIRQATAVLERYLGIIDHVICDDYVDDGEAAAPIRELCARLGVPCTVVSGSLGGREDIAKPFTWGELLDRLSRV